MISEKQIEEIEGVINNLVLDLSDAEYINSSLNLVSDLFLDSLDLVCLASSIEEIFDILIEDVEIANSENFSNIKTITRFVGEKLGGEK